MESPKFIFVVVIFSPMFQAFSGSPTNIEDFEATDRLNVKD